MCVSADMYLLIGACSFRYIALHSSGARPRLVVAAWAEHPQFCFYQSDDYPIDLWAGLDDPTRFRDLTASLHSSSFNSLIVTST